MNYSAVLFKVIWYSQPEMSFLMDAFSVSYTSIIIKLIRTITDLHEACRLNPYRPTGVSSVLTINNFAFLRHYAL